MAYNDAQFSAEFNRRYPCYSRGTCDPTEFIEAVTWRMRNVAWAPELRNALKKIGIDASDISNDDLLDFARGHALVVSLCVYNIS